MCELEIQSPVSNICCRLQIMFPLLWRHTAPNILALFISPDIINLRERVQNTEVHQADRNEHAIAALVARCVVCTVDVRGYNSGSLDEHVVQRRIDGARCYCACIA